MTGFFHKHKPSRSLVPRIEQQEGAAVNHDPEGLDSFPSFQTNGRTKKMFSVNFHSGGWKRVYLLAFLNSGNMSFHSRWDHRENFCLISLLQLVGQYIVKKRFMRKPPSCHIQNASPSFLLRTGSNSPICSVLGRRSIESNRSYTRLHTSSTAAHRSTTP